MSVTVVLVIACCIVSIICFNNPDLFQKLKHWPYAEYKDKQYYRFLSSGFVHGSWLHLFINMFVFWQFGEMVEHRYQLIFGADLGRILYLLLFLITIICADIPTYLKHKDNPYYSAVGASGAVSGILFASIVFDPWMMLYLYAILPIPAIIAAVLYLVYSAWASKNSQDNIDHDAHFYGAIFGMLFTFAASPPLIQHFLNKLLTWPF